MTEEKITLDENINIFSDELKRSFSKDDIEEIARETGFVKRKGKIDAWELFYLCSWGSIPQLDILYAKKDIDP